ncbi:hypothetical protein OYC64_004651 [Pagothenia borchgrevinki]|uniref:Uncharacterized protein n=1 Tax=Pagothenia borchgrevinki TaxID=8213 RepID=A0ABD2FZ54_PAGBO
MEELERQRQRQAELTAQKARKEEEKSKREELVKILEENNRQMKTELERAAAKKLEKVNSSLQRHLQRSTEEKEERQRELISMKGQIATLMQRQQFRADPAQLERKNRIAKRKKGKLPSDFTPPPEETMLHKGKQKPCREAKVFKTLCFRGRGVRKCNGGDLWGHRSRPPLRIV